MISARWLFSALLLIAAPGPAPHAPPGAAALGAIVGTWQSDATDGVSARSACAWTPQHAAVLCDQTVTTPTGVQHATDLFTFDAASGKYFFYLVQHPGADAPAVPLTIEGPIWTYGGQTAGRDGRRHRTINDFSKSDRYMWRAESSTDGEHWTRVAGGESARVKRQP